jgi:hypothetical protein
MSEVDHFRWFQRDVGPLAGLRRAGMRPSQDRRFRRAGMENSLYILNLLFCEFVFELPGFSRRYLNEDPAKQKYWSPDERAAA